MKKHKYCLKSNTNLMKFIFFFYSTQELEVLKVAGYSMSNFVQAGWVLNVCFHSSSCCRCHQYRDREIQHPLSCLKSCHRLSLTFKSTQFYQCKWWGNESACCYRHCTPQEDSHPNLGHLPTQLPLSFHKVKPDPPLPAPLIKPLALEFHNN